MTYCGVPRHVHDGSPFRRDRKSIHKVAEHAVKDVYQFCPSYSGSAGSTLSVDIGVSPKLTTQVHVSGALWSKYACQETIAITRRRPKIARTPAHLISYYDRFGPCAGRFHCVTAVGRCDASTDSIDLIGLT